MPLSKSARAASFAASALVSSALGCAATADPPPAPPAGTAVMQWSLDQATDPSSCGAHGASTFHVSLYSGAGRFAGEWVQDCTAFAATIDGLDPDDYTGHAVLTDSSGNARTTSVNLKPITVIGNTSTTVTIDFPASSFY